MRESKIQSEVIAYAIRKGWYAGKFEQAAKSGFPDCIMFKNDKCILIEFKATGETPSRQQLKRHKDLKMKGVIVHVVDDIQQGKLIIDSMGQYE